MKKAFLLLAFSVSLILASCSQLDQENSPVAPTLTKQVDPVNIDPANIINFPYEYLSAFPEIEYAKWEESYSDNQWVIVTLDRSVKKFHHLYCEIVYSSENEPTNEKRELIFAGKPGTNKIAVSKTYSDKIEEVNVYAVADYGSDDRPLPYKTGEKLNTIFVKSWDIQDDAVLVNTSGEIYTSSQVYAQIDSEKGNMLVFVGNPAAETFNIPNFANIGVNNVELYGFINVERAYNSK
jgi:hypothetical protein